MLAAVLLASGAQGAQSTTLSTSYVIDLTPDYAVPGAKNVPIFNFTLTDTASETFTQAIITFTGSASADVSDVLLYAESDGFGGTFDAASDTFLARGAFSGGTVALALSFTFTAGVPQEFYVVFNISNSAASNDNVDARIANNDLTVGGKTWPNTPMNPNGNTVIDGTLPGSWATFTPAGWVNTQTPTATVKVSDSVSGLKVSTAEYQYSTDGGGSWSAWQAASCTGADGTVAQQTITAANVPFNQDSGTQNLIKFRIGDMAGNTGTSASYTVKVDSLPPGDWQSLSPSAWYTASRTPTVALKVQDAGSGLDTGTPQYDYSTDGGNSWAGWSAATVSGAAGSTALETITAANVPFNQESATQNRIRFRISDAGGSQNTSAIYIIKIDTTPPGAWDSPTPAGWYTASGTPTVTINVSDSVSGLDNGSVQFDYSTNGGASWAGWSAATLTGPTGSTASETITAADVPFNQDSGTQNRIRFRISDAGGTQNTSAVYIIKTDSTPPGAWDSLTPAGWFRLNQTPTVTLSASDAASGLNVSRAFYNFSRDGGTMWSGWMAASSTGTSGSTAAETLTAADVPFNQDSGTQNLISFLIYDEAGNSNQSVVYTVRIDTAAPFGWRLISPGGWYTANQTPPVSVLVADNTSGLDSLSGEYRYSTDGGTIWSAWMTAALTGNGGAGVPWNLTAQDVPFNQDSRTKNAIQLRIRDIAGNTATGDPLTIAIDTERPGGWDGFLPAAWVNSTAPTCSISASDNTSGVNRTVAEYAVSTDGGATWKPWRAAVVRGGRAAVTIEAAGAPFGQDSATLNYIRFRVADEAGNSAESPSYLVKTDSTPPPRPVMAPEPAFTRGRSNTVSAGAVNDTGVGGVAYRFQCALDEKFTTIIMETAWTPSASYPFTGLLDGKIYYFRVVARDALNNTAAPSDPVSSTQDDSPPEAVAPFPLPPFVNSTAVAVSAPTAHDGGSGGVEYRFLIAADRSFASPASDSGWLKTNSTTFQGLIEGTEYFVRVDVRDALGNGANGTNYNSTRVDLSPPRSTLKTGPAEPDGLNSWFRTQPLVDLSAADGLSGVDAIYYALDSGAAVRYTAAFIVAEGVHTVTWWAVDRAGNIEASRTETIRTDLTAPVPVISPPARAYADEPLALGGENTTATDEPASGLSFRWDFGDETGGTGVTASHAYSAPGRYTVHLIVTDRAGNSAAAEVTVQVFERGVNSPPVAVISPLPPVYSGEPVRLDGSNSTDEDPSSLVFTWEVGDNTTGKGATLEHTYAASGRYTVKLTVRDSGGLVDTVSREIAVFAKGTNNPPMAVIRAQSTAYTGESVLFDGAESLDEEPARLNFTWSVANTTAGYGSRYSHVFPAAGTYTVTLVVRDGGGLSGTATVTIMVFVRGKNLPPVASLVPPEPAGVKEPVLFDASPTLDESPETLRYSWNFGDGTTASGRYAKHTYPSSGRYVVRLTVTDSEGLASTATTVVEVKGAARSSQVPVSAYLLSLFFIAAVAAAGAGLYSYSRRKRSAGAVARPAAGHAQKAPPPPEALPDETGLNYMVCEPHPEKAYALMKAMAAKGLAGLCLTHTFPDKIRKKHGLEGVTLHWLTDLKSPEEKTLDPSRLDYEVMEILLGFLKEKKGVLMLDGVENLIQLHGFEKVMEFMAGVNELASAHGATVIVPVAPEGLSRKERSLLRKRFDRVVGELEVSKGEEEEGEGKEGADSESGG